jgi:hypothetical protein
LCIQTSAPTKAAISKTHTYQRLCVRFETPSSMRVGSGNFAPRPLKNFVNFGNTYTAMMTTVTIDIASTTSG